jgi:transcriptional regulator with XRE-family HTH domain
MRRYLKEHGIRYRFVAERAGINPNRFYRLINGTSPLTVDEYEVICRKGFGLDPGYFFREECLSRKQDDEC